MLRLRWVCTCRRGLGWMAGPGVPGRGRAVRLAEQFGERGDGFEQQGVDAGLLVGGAAGAEFGDGAAVLGLGGELAYPGGDGRAGDGRGPGCRGAGRGLAGHGQSRVSSATAFFAQVSSMRSWPAAAPAMIAAVAALLRARGRPPETRCRRAIASSADRGSGRPGGGGGGARGGGGSGGRVVGEEGLVAGGEGQVVPQVGG